MPRIRHWFHVSHDINSDEEVWELTETFGDWGLRVWLQLLSISDRNEGRVKGNLDTTSKAMSRLWGSNSRRYNTGWRQNRARMMLEWMQDKRWIKIESESIYVCNYSRYNPSRDAKGNGTNPLLSPPYPLPSPSPKKIKNKSQPSVVFVLPDWVPISDWEEFKEHRRTKCRKPMTGSIATRLVGVLDELRGLGHEPAAVLHEAIDRDWIAFKVSWIVNSGSRNGRDEETREQALARQNKITEIANGKLRHG